MMKTHFESDLATTGVPIVKAEINGKKAYFIVDSGATSSLIALEVCNDYGVIVQTASQQITGVGASTKMYQSNAIISCEDVNISPVKATPLSNLIQSVKSRCFIKIAGVIGSDAMRENKLIIDYSNNQLRN